jgi:hypothetical protein
VHTRYAIKLVTARMSTRSQNISHEWDLNSFWKAKTPRPHSIRNPFATTRTEVWNGTTLVTKNKRGHEAIQSQTAKRAAVPRAVALPSLETPQPKSPAKFHNLQVHPQQKEKKKAKTKSWYRYLISFPLPPGPVQMASPAMPCWSCSTRCIYSVVKVLHPRR